MGDRSRQFAHSRYAANMSQFGLSFPQRNFLLMQLLLGLFALGYVDDNHREKRRSASTGRDQHRTDIRPHYIAIFAKVALLQTINSAPPGIDIRDASFGGSSILFMADVSNRAPLEFGFSITEHFLKSQVCCNEAAVRSNQCNALPRACFGFHVATTIQSIARQKRTWLCSSDRISPAPRRRTRNPVTRR